nr:MAG TPA: hypothetical protein [Caudoviricetes sp.]
MMNSLVYLNRDTKLKLHVKYIKYVLDFLG